MILTFENHEQKDDFLGEMAARKPNAHRYVHEDPNGLPRFAVAAFSPEEGLWIKNNVEKHGGQISFMLPSTEVALAEAAIAPPPAPYHPYSSGPSNGYRPRNGHGKPNGTAYTRPHGHYGNSGRTFAFQQVIH